MSKKNKYKILIIVILLPTFIFIISSYLKVEILTYKYSEEFDHKEIYGADYNQLEYIKVFDYSIRTSIVYYVRKDKTNGMLVELIKDGTNNWVIKKYIKEWSKTGTADDFIWPYYP